LHAAHLYLCAAFCQGFANGFSHASRETGSAGIRDQDFVVHLVFLSPQRVMTVSPGAWEQGNQ